MKLLCTGDWQTQFSNLSECERSLEELLALAKELKPDAIINFGDFKNAYNPIDIRVAKFGVRSTNRIVKAGFDYYILLGNHDRISQSRDAQNWLEILRAAGAKTISKPRRVSIGDGTVYFMPFTADKKLERRWAASLAVRLGHGPRVLCFHTGIMGAWLNSVAKDQDGITPEELFAGSYNLCLGGHYHRHQKIGKNIFYIGNPFCQEWGDVNQEKGHVVAEISRDSFSVKQALTAIPQWYDSDFLERRKIKPEPGDYIRSKVTVKSKHVRDDIQKEERRLRKLYGNKVRLFVIPRFEDTDHEELVLKGTTDKELIASYIVSTIPDDSRFTSKQALSYLASRLVGLRGASNLSTVAFLKAWGTNVLSFKQVSVDYQNQGIVLLRGEHLDWPKRSNGSGKTNTLSLLPVPLFGVTLKKQKHDQWARESTNKTADANLLMRINKKLKVLVTRTRRPHSLRLEINGKDVSTGIRSSGKQETQGLIEKTIGFDMCLLLNSVYLDQTIANSFVFGTQKDRMDIIERLLNIERFDEAIKLVNKDITHTSKVADKLHDQLEVLEDAVDELKDQLQDNNFKTATDWQQKANKARKEVKQKRLAKVSLTQLKTTYDEKRDELTEMNRSIDDATTRLNTYQGMLEYWTNRINTASSLIKKGRCTKCEQPSKLAGKSMLTEAESKMRVYVNHIGSAKLGINKLKAEYEHLEDSIDKYDYSVQRATLELEAVREALIDIEDGEREEKKRNAILDQRHKQVAAKLAFKQRVYKATERSYKHSQIHLELLQYAKDAFSRSGMPLYLAATMCPVLNASADEYADIFDSQLKLHFEVNESKFIVDAINPSGSSVLNGQSSGESAMAGFICALAIRDSGPRTNLLVIDEPGNGLDPEGAKMLAEAILKLKNKFETVLITTHNQTIEGVLSGEKTWTVRKQHGISTLHC